MIRLLLCFVCFSQGFAQDIELETVGRFPLESMTDKPYRANDIWGYLDPEGTPYALLGSYTSVHAFDVGTPNEPREAAAVALVDSRWKDIKTFTYADGRSYAFVVADGAESPGLMVLDLNQLPEKLEIAAIYPFFYSAHNIFISPDFKSPYAYVCESGSGPESGVYVIDISDPLQAEVVYHYNLHGVHDIYVGSHWADPFADGRDLGLLFSGNDGLVVVDFTNKTRPRAVSQFSYQDMSYTHSGWVDESGRYVYICDELDETGFGLNTRLHVADLGSVLAPRELSFWEGPRKTIDHNAFVKGDHLYMSHYTDGLSVFDISEPSKPERIAQTYPFEDQGNIPVFAGFWGIYPFFEDMVVASDVDHGLVVIKTTPITEPTLVHSPDLELCNGGGIQDELRLAGPDQGPQTLSVLTVPDGLEVRFSRATVAAGEAVRVTFQSSPTMEPGTYTVRLGIGDLVAGYQLRITRGYSHLKLLAPQNGETTVSAEGLLVDWEFDEPNATFELSLWSEEDRSDLFVQDYFDSFGYFFNLEPHKTYFWQVAGAGKCRRTLSEVQSFTTSNRKVLLVERTDQRAESVAWRTALIRLGITYDLAGWQVNPFNNVADYDMVIWFSGEEERPFLPADQEEILRQYALGGGHLVLCSPNFYTGRGGTVDGLLRDAMGLAEVTPDGADFSHLSGLGNWGFLGEGAANVPTGNHDHLVADRGSEAVLYNELSGDVAAVATPNTLYLGLPLNHMFDTSQDLVYALVSELYIRAMSLTPNSSKVYRRYLPLEGKKLTHKVRLVLINPSDQAVAVEVLGVDKQGRGTGLAAPTLPPRGRTTLSKHSISGGLAITYNHVMIMADQPLAVMLEGEGFDEAYALPASRELLPELSLPHIALDTTHFFTVANVINGAENEVETVMTTPDTTTWALEAGTPLSGTFLDITALIADQPGPGRGHAVIRARDGDAPIPALAAVELFGAKTAKQIAGLTLGKPTQTLVFSHIASVPNGWWTGLAAVNMTAETAEIMLSAYDGNGQVVAAQPLQLPSGGKILDYVIEGYRANALIPEGLPEEAVWLRMTSSVPLTGYELFSDRDNRLLAGLSANSRAAEDLILPFVGDLDRYAGVALLNDNPEPQQLIIQLFNSEGVLRTTLNETVPAYGRILATGHDLFGEILNEGATYARVTAPNGVYGFVIAGDWASTWLTALEGWELGLDE